MSNNRLALLGLGLTLGMTRDIHDYAIYDKNSRFKVYVIDNCVPCCYRCNIMKNNFSQESFLNHTQKIVTNMEQKYAS